MKYLRFVTIAILVSSCNSSINVATSTIPAFSYLANCSGETGDANAAWGKSIKPSEIYINGLSPCMASGTGDKIEITKWTTWSSDVATGIGRFGYNTYIPNGAAENYDFYNITITLDTPINGFFSKMHLSWTVEPPDAMETYDVQPMSFNEGQLMYGPETDCNNGSSWTYNDTLPIEICNQGRGVEYIQSALGLNPDGYFGADTWNALGRFQIDHHLTEFGNIGPETWKALIPDQNGLPGHDYNADGLITPDEFGE